MRSKPNFLRFAPRGEPSSTQPGSGRISWLPRLIASFVLLMTLSSPLLAQQSSGLFKPAAPMTPATFQFSADEIRSETATLSDCQTVAEMVPVLREEKGLMRKGWDAALRSAEAFKASSIANGQRADNAERKWQLEHENFTAEQGLTDQARAETKAAVKKGRWNLIKGIFWGLAIGAGAGAIYGASR